MHGFIALISKDLQKLKPSIQWKPLFDFQDKHIQRKVETETLLTEQFTSEKFITEKLWQDTDNYFIVTDGVITNLELLCNKYNVKNYNELIEKIYTQKDFFAQFRGHFSGFLLNKKTNSAVAFNNHAGSKRLFYYSDNDVAIFCTDLFTLSKCLESYSIAKSLDIDAAYLLLTSGYMHENYTLIKEVKQLRAGECVYLANKKLNTKLYFDLRDIKENNDSEEETIAHLDRLFKQSLSLEFEIDKKAQLNSMTTLSGGMDSRAVAIIAHELGYQHQKLINYCEKGYADQVISKQIAEQYNLDIQHVSLSPAGLCAIDDIVKINDGLAISLGSGHIFDAIQRFKFENTGLIHTGITGDSVMGSTVSQLQQVKPSVNMCLYAKGLLDKAEPILRKDLDNYENEELYKFYNPILMGESNGFLFFDLIGECTSAFQDPDFLTYAYSMPRKYRFNKRLYLKWVINLHPSIATFTWESMGGKPTTSKFLKHFYRYKRAIVKRLPIHTMWKNTMNPEQLWYDKNVEVQTYFDNYFNNHIDLISFDSELKQDVISVFKKGNVYDKSQVLTLLGAYKLLF